jgi:5-(carboxyamino)imidazole ribonucleotide synthase
MLGGGQLGKYTVAAANAMGYRTIVVDPDPAAPARVVADEHVVAGFDDSAAIDRLASACAVVTTEFENAPAESLRRLAASTVVAPGADAVAVAQDRIVEKTTLRGGGAAVGPFAPLPHDAEPATVAAARQVATNGAIVKTARFGYDGKGQVRITHGDELDAARRELGDVDIIVESLLSLDVELSVVVARTVDGQIATWEVTENIHVDGILDVSIAPARVPETLRSQARDLAVGVATTLDYVGVMGVEMFVVDGELLVNEIAPRPHNSGHWTLDASVTSQFEQQVRSVCGVGLGDTTMTAPSVAMVNLLGDLWFGEPTGEARVAEPRWVRALSDPAATLHLYGKREPRRARKMGHVTVTADDPETAARRALDLRAALRPTVRTT